MRYDFARQMLRQRPALRSRLQFLRRRDAIRHSFHLSLGCLFLFQLELKLFELEDDLLALLAEHHVPQLLDHELQMFDPLAA